MCAGGVDCAWAMNAVFFRRSISDGTSKQSSLEVTMKKEILEDRKARWEMFEWMGSTQSKVIWAVAAAIVVLGIVYLLR
jgi:hypothetical protein